jgi:hypothetical protein
MKIKGFFGTKHSHILIWKLLVLQLATDCICQLSDINVTINDGSLNETYDLSVKDGQQQVMRYIINNVEDSVDFAVRERQIQK